MSSNPNVHFGMCVTYVFVFVVLLDINQLDIKKLKIRPTSLNSTPFYVECFYMYRRCMIQIHVQYSFACFRKILHVDINIKKLVENEHKLSNIIKYKRIRKLENGSNIADYIKDSMHLQCMIE